ncbi:MAG TPA: SpoIIE family protein phosphatase [Leptospiraceae bacterium]|nr:SpoIIE family protein phosphatase [Leptospiraceae bacterium]HMW05690.1 SpoIIE family protein phosphatase [Leptospiraceae bacterium]HMY30277.1 SpoIIE family protein phosphatase [Leptospiraceae bacterium]HMZ66390.1 SpoIIE family protein phosphatase [Leptospiraceae bacterium]HNA07144.1 SpoIIE family protein phosphatase [Leptospiraceae bacterium]
MNSILFSYYAPGVFFDTLIALLISIFLIFKKEKSIATYWLIGFFLGEFSLFAAYTASYSIFNEVGAYHRYFSCLVMFGNASLVGFSYFYQKNDKPKEGMIVISLSFIIALVAYIHFILKTISMEKIYNPEAHIYTFDFGKEVGIVIALLFLVSLINLIRKTIRYSTHSDFFGKWTIKPQRLTGYPVYYLKSFFLGIYKIYSPRGKEAESTRDFAIPIFLQILIALLNVLVKSGKISYELYALLFSFSTMIVIYNIAIVYLNHSPEPTSFMVKLVGISLGAILVVLAIVGQISLNDREENYNTIHLLKINQAKIALNKGNWEDIPSDVEYILMKPKNSSFFSKDTTILLLRDPAVTLEDIYKEVDKEKEKTIQAKISANKDKTLSTEQKYQIALEEINSYYPPEQKRLYRQINHKLFTQFDFVEEENRYEIGFNLRVYREYIHSTSKNIIITMISVFFSVLAFFPMLFKTSLVSPLRKLLDGVKNVNDGDLSVQVPVKSYDEIGFLAVSFNSMVKSIRQAREDLQDYAENLELRVDERTREVREKMELIESLKIQQDADYFLTSLLAKPLFYNANKSTLVKTEFIIKQKKQFEFKNKRAELGGDICITGNLRLGTKENYKRYTMAMNGDAMGKSMQGAGGSLVMGVMMNSIMARSASQNKILNQTPEEWLRLVYQELHSVFKSFNGSMVISAVIFIIEDETGKGYFINAEHPFSVLYRDGRASFIEKELQLRKIGFDIDTEFKYETIQLQERDVIILGSDGRDDIDLTPKESVRTINEDETIFLQLVEKAESDISKIVDLIGEVGTIIDDLSLLRIGYKEEIVEIEKVKEPEVFSESDITIQVDKDGFTKTRTDIHTNIALNTDNAYLEGKALSEKGRIDEAINILYSAFTLDKTHSELTRLLGVLAFKAKDYKKAIEALKTYTSHFEREEELLYSLAISCKKMEQYKDSLSVSTLLERINPKLIRNLLNLADANRLIGNFQKAKEFSERVISMDPKNEIALKILKIVS